MDLNLLTLNHRPRNFPPNSSLRKMDNKSNQQQKDVVTKSKREFLSILTYLTLVKKPRCMPANGQNWVMLA